MPDPSDLYISNVPKSSQQTVIVICCVFLTATWLTLFMRLWVRAGVLRNAFGWDDGIMALTNCIFTGFCIMTILATSLAAGGDIQQYGVDKMSTLTKDVTSAFTLYIMTMVLFKIALAIFYLRVVVRRWQQWTVYVALAVNTTYGLFYFFIVLFRCGNPANYLQNQLLGQCLSNEILYGINMASGVINAATDWALAILPIFVLRQADLSLRTRLAVCFVLMLGTLGSIMSVVRLPYIKGLAQGPNFFRGAVKITIWSIIEPGFGITAACLVTLRPLFKCVGESPTATPSRSVPDPNASTVALGDRPARAGSFSTWQTAHIKNADWEALEMQQRLDERPTFQDRLNHAKAEEDARTSFATARSRTGQQPSLYSDRSYSMKSGETRNFSRPTPMPHLSAQLVPPLPPQSNSVQRSMSERGSLGADHQHGRQKSKQTL